MKKEIEILAPAGSYDTLKQAIDAGADAVYVGGSRFGARAYAQNFTEEELLEAIDYVHLRGKKLYLTVNTLIKEKEFGELYDYLLPYYIRGLDAVIVQDMGVMEYIKHQFPLMDIHASTQMTVTNHISASYLESTGVSRVVPARELSLSEIRDIAAHTELEIECFVHGALCYSYSGQCLMSSMIGGRSGNRGQCAQPCRLPYKVGEAMQPADIMSLKDLCTIEHIPDLVEAGITSFKIEGRMKQASYVSVITAMYRKYTDQYIAHGRKGFRVTKEDKEMLWQAYRRRGYCDGYYYRQNGKDMLSLERPRKEAELSENLVVSKTQEKIKGTLVLIPESNAQLFLEYNELHIEVSGDWVDYAKNQPITEERLRKQMCKTGNTPFAFETLEICLADQVFVSVQSLNELRRRGLGLLEEKILEHFRREEPKRLEISQKKDKPQSSNKLSAVVETLEQLEVCVSSIYIDRIYMEDFLWPLKSEKSDNAKTISVIEKQVSRAHQEGKEVYFAMARIFRDKAAYVYQEILPKLTMMFDGVLVRNLEEVLYLKENGYEKPIIADMNMYQWNREAKNFWKTFSLSHTTAPVELNVHELRELDVEDMEMMVYGYLPVMTSAGCIQKNTRSCTGEKGTLCMTDRYQKKFMVKNICNYCYNVVYNTLPIMLADQKNEIELLEPWKLRLQFTFEDRRKTEEIIELFGKIFVDNKETEIPEMEFTRGHFKRGVK